MSSTMFLHAEGAELAASIAPRDYNRLLQMPRERVLEDELLERAEGARQWYAAHGKPFVAARRVAVALSPHQEHDIEVVDTGMHLQSFVLASRLRAGEAHALMLVAASAGPAVSEEVARLWVAGCPDEAYFLDRFAVGITERLLFWTSATLCRTSESVHETLMPHLSPGCGSWDLSDQHKVWALLAGDSNELGPLRIMDSGALHPQHSIVAASGVTHRNFSSTPDQLCRSCDLRPCAFRRAPYSGDPIHLMISQETR